VNLKLLTTVRCIKADDTHFTKPVPTSKAYKMTATKHDNDGHRVDNDVTATLLWP